MPQETAATWSRSGSPLTISRVFIQVTQSDSATQAPVMAAVRVPPSAWITSQSTVICRSPSAGRSSTARRLRPISRWISMVRPLCLPADASRRVRSEVARGSMPYSAVTQPRACPLSQGGSRSSSVAVTRTWVSPNFTKQEPSAYFTTPRSSEMARSSSGWRRLGRMLFSYARPGTRDGASLLGAQARADKGERQAGRSLRLDAGVLDHLGPLDELDLDEVAELARRAAECFEAERRDPRLDLRVVDDLARLGIELGDDGGRRVRRHEHGHPRIHVEALHAGLVQSRQIGNERAALHPRHRQGPQLAGLDMGKGGGQVAEHHRHAARDHVVDGRRRASIGNVGET